MSVHYTVTRGQDKGFEHCIRFTDKERDGGKPLSTTFVPRTLEAELDDLRINIKLLVDAARDGKGRGSLDLMSNSTHLRRLILGDATLSYLTPFKPAILLDVDKYCARIEWELVADRYEVCKDKTHNWTRGLGEQDEKGKCCPQGHELILSDYPLGITKHLGIRHIQWNAPILSRKPPNKPPTKILIIGDPEEKLDTTGHLFLLEEFFKQGYDPELRVGPQATCKCVIDALENDDYAAIYIFAHGSCADKEGPSRIHLSGGLSGEFLHAGMLPPRFNCQPLIFLNSCYNAKNSNWLETVEATDSLAGEMLRRGASAVIGALCPILNGQASRAAMLFFHEALLASTFGQALAKARMDSYLKYVGGESDLSWFAYRLYGDPDRCLASEIWNPDGTLRKEPFSIDPARLEEIMKENMRQRGGAELSLEDLLHAAAKIGASGITNVGSSTFREEAKTAWRSIKAIVSKAFTAIVSPKGEPTPSATKHGVIFQSNEDLRAAFVELLHKHKERLQKVEQLDIEEPFPLNPADLLDACRLPSIPIIRDIQGQSRDIVIESLRMVEVLLSELDSLRGSMTLGMYLVILQASQNSLSSVTHADPYPAMLAAFLQHVITKSPRLRIHKADIEGLIEKLLLIARDPRQIAVAKDMNELMKKLVEMVGPDGKLDERRIFSAMHELTPKEWRPPIT